MAGDNLDITIGADTSKARHEMELLNAEMRKTQKEIKATADAAAKGDTTAVTKLKAQTAAYDAMAKQVVKLKKEVAGANTELHKLHAAEHKHGFYLVENSVQSLNGAFMALGHNLAGARAGIAGFVVAIGIEKFIEMVNEASKRLTELRSAASDIGIKPIALQAAQEVVGKIGEDADVATKALQGMGAQLEEIRKQSIQPPGRTSVFRGGTGTGMATVPGGVPSGLGVQVFRGGQQQPRDFSQPLEILGIANALKALPNNKLGELQSYVIQLKAFVQASKTFDPTALNIISKTLFAGVPASSMLKTAPALIEKLQGQIAELQQTQRGATDEAIAKNEELIASQAKLATATNELMSQIANATLSSRIAINEWVTLWIEDNIKLLTEWGRFWNSIVNVVSNAANSIKSVLSGLSSAVSNALSSAGQAISDAAAQGAGLGFARGGYVTGPGTGTSDSIMARLSAGEYVVNAARVRELGLGFMQQLNGFAAGGLVGRFPRFAEGGLVGGGAGAGGTPINLHIGDGVFTTHAPPAVAQALVVEARRLRVRSAGVKPSWYGGR